MLDILDSLGVYAPGAGRYFADVPCPAPVAVNGGTRPCGSHVVNAITGRCDAHATHR